ncbi:PLC-like phosphodiesterase, TIM beta/alpha-barrel domain [Pseudocohnilembus persalinus]|uniref:PLC-like phosphodiesterase, TIM beta/alpha-barrel domain n=1 Tax=Pseudocohnilembus persalinus TaxID=266149 RepID=A0A0V0Q9E1_PSEPJ|nr:PLC-like phosphodiesterase, TIM beta/alpha-barrel domain [Pseudocohnilembus persalinus]|eukprot:KRW98644.1 PLC-like phosphodiesterase, TIM beta/alpha-barrel domain [Pseudocohnilembus persalinus]
MGNYHAKILKNECVNSQQLPTKVNKQWMKELDENLYISQISLPGSHNSIAIHGEFLCCSSKSQCQSMDLTNQLFQGIRYFDIDMKISSTGRNLKGYNGFVDQNIRIDSIFEQFYDFLEDNPSETILLQLNHENKNNKENLSKFQNVFLKKLNFYNKKIKLSKRPQIEVDQWFYLKNQIPKLNEVRGKVVLIRNFYGTEGIQYFKNQKIIVQESLDKTIEQITNNIQQHHKYINKEYLSLQMSFNSIDQKKQLQNELQNNEEGYQQQNGNIYNYNENNDQQSQDISYIENKKQNIYINTITKKGTFSRNPLSSALQLNKIIYSLQGFFGIILLDFPSEKLVQYIIDQNFNSFTEAIKKLNQEQSYTLPTHENVISNGQYVELISIRDSNRNNKNQ